MRRCVDKLLSGVHNPLHRHASSSCRIVSPVYCLPAKRMPHAFAGQPLSVAAIGASVIGGTGAFPHIEGSLGALDWFTQWLHGVSPGVAHTIKNAALAGTQSSEA